MTRANDERLGEAKNRSNTGAHGYFDKLPEEQEFEQKGTKRA